MRVPVIFCPKCGNLIHDQLVCPNCYWPRSYADLSIGHLRWETSVGEKIDYAPSPRLEIVASSVIVGTRSGRLIAFSDANGKLLWRNEDFSGLRIRGMTAWRHYLVLTAHSDLDAEKWMAVLALVDSTTGNVAQRYDLAATGISAPVIHNELVFFTAAIEGTVPTAFAVDLLIEKIRWHQEVPRNQFIAPLITAETVWFGLGTASLKGFSVSGVEQTPEEKSLLVGETSRFVVAGKPNTLFVVTIDDEIYCLDTNTGMIIDRLRIDGEILHRPSFQDGSLYMVLMKELEEFPSLYRFEINHGDTQLFRLFSLENPANVEPLFIDDTIAFVDKVGCIHLYDFKGNLKFTEETSIRTCAPMVVSGDCLYLLGRNGKVQSRYWRQPTHLEKLPEVYEQSCEWGLAALGYTLGDDWKNAARCFERAQLWREAGALHRLQGNFYDAGRMCEKTGDLLGALADYRNATLPTQMIVILEKLKRFREAGEVCEAAGNLSRAIENYQKAGEFPTALELLKREDDTQSVKKFLDQMPDGEIKALEFEMAGDYTRAAKAWKNLQKPKLAARAYWLAGDAAQSFKILGQCNGWDEIVDLYEQHERENTYISLGIEELHILFQALEKSMQVPCATSGKAILLKDMVGRYIDIAKQVFHLCNEQPTPGVESLLAKLHGSAAKLYEEMFDWKAAEEQERLVRRFKHWPRLKIKVSEDTTFVTGRLGKLSMTIHNVGYGDAANIRIYLSGLVEDRTEKLPGIKMGDVLPINLQVGVRSKVDGLDNVGESELKIQFEYQRPDGDWCESEVVRLFIPVLPYPSADTQPDVVNVYGPYYERPKEVIAGDQYLAPVHTGDHVEIKRSVQGEGRLRCPKPDCRFVLDQYTDYRYCPACGTPLKWVD